MKLAVVCNLRPTVTDGGKFADDTYIEWDDPETIEAIARALREGGTAAGERPGAGATTVGAHDVTVLEQRDDLEARLRALRPAMVFNVAEGLHGANRESEVPELLERLGIPYTGSGPATLRTGLDKAATKEALLRADIPTPRHVALTDAASAAAEVAAAGMRFPLIVKPLLEGSSKGIYNDSVVRTEPELQTQVARVLTTYRQPALVETFLTGREFTVALLGNAPEVRALPPVEVLFHELPDGATPIYSYEAKWIWDTPEAPLPLFACPAKLTPETEAAITDVCRRAFIALGCRDWCRIDVRLDDAGRPHVLELNPLPGIIPDLEATSCFTKAAHAAGMSHGEIVRTVFALACRRHGLMA